MPASIERKNENCKKDSLVDLPEFDFDEWVLLHKNDPVAFEEKRSEWLTTCIIEAPEKYQNRLNGLMFHINTIRRLEKNPMQTCIKISTMMMDSLNDLRVFLSDLNSTINHEPESTQIEKVSADILQFVRA